MTFQRCCELATALPGVVEESSYADRTTCFQVMECDDESLLTEWMSRWIDLVDFEVHPVTTSAEAAAIINASGDRARPQS